MILIPQIIFLIDLFSSSFLVQPPGFSNYSVLHSIHSSFLSEVLSFHCLCHANHPNPYFEIIQLCFHFCIQVKMARRNHYLQIYADINCMVSSSSFFLSCLLFFLLAAKVISNLPQLQLPIHTTPDLSFSVSHFIYFPKKFQASNLNSFKSISVSSYVLTYKFYTSYIYPHFLFHCLRSRLLPVKR